MKTGSEFSQCLTSLCSVIIIKMQSDD